MRVGFGKRLLAWAVTIGSAAVGADLTGRSWVGLLAGIAAFVAVTGVLIRPRDERDQESVESPKSPRWLAWSLAAMWAGAFALASSLPGHWGQHGRYYAVSLFVAMALSIEIDLAAFAANGRHQQRNSDRSSSEVKRTVYSTRR
jgi:crotonobetainyl-CoA:carnitine CoA-transferase CaiB-like acyl-CoA transferase